MKKLLICLVSLSITIQVCAQNKKAIKYAKQISVKGATKHNNTCI